jgi:hypothetical protein
MASASTAIARLKCLVASLVLALVAGCSNGVTVYVQLQTDYVAGVEFDEVVAQSIERRSASIDAGELFARPVQVAEYRGLSTARFDVEVSLRLRGRVVATARRAQPLRGDAVVLVILTRDCREVSCPAPGRAEATECVQGQCVPPECDDPSCGVGHCTRDDECSSAARCVVARCREGLCLQLSDPGACAAGERCVPESGCVPVTGAADAGVVDARALEDAPSPPDAQPDAPVTRPSFTLQRWVPGNASWMRVEASGGPSAPLEGAFPRPGRDQLVLLTATELAMLDPVTQTVVERLDRDTVFPELAGLTVSEAATIAPNVFFYVGDEAIRFSWDGASGSVASFDWRVPNDWMGDFAPSSYDIQGVFYLPDNAQN